jgi:hypothetical protein
MRMPPRFDDVPLLLRETAELHADHRPAHQLNQVGHFVTSLDKNQVQSCALPVTFMPLAPGTANAHANHQAAHQMAQFGHLVPH